MTNGDSKAPGLFGIGKRAWSWRHVRGAAILLGGVIVLSAQGYQKWAPSTATCKATQAANSQTTPLITQRCP